MEKFWLVWNPAGNSPRYKHPSEESAEREAERLAALNPSDSFYVLEALTCSRNIAVRTTRLEHALPF